MKSTIQTKSDYIPLPPPSKTKSMLNKDTPNDNYRQAYEFNYHEKLQFQMIIEQNDNSSYTGYSLTWPHIEVKADTRADAITRLKTEIMERLAHVELLTIEIDKDEIDHFRLMAALKMFELGEISSGQAAKLLGIARVDFLELCGQYQVSIFNYGPDEIEAELRKDLQTLKEIFV